MRFTHFTLKQDGAFIGSSTVLQQAVSEARQHAVDTGKPVTVMAHIDGGGTKEAIFHPNGTNDKIWNIDKGRPLAPTVGQVYLNRSGGEYRCISYRPMPGTMYYNSAGGSSSTTAVFRNVKSGWTFVAKGIIQYIDGTIEWNHSSDGCFKDKEDD